jgi:hypothetical protein
VDAELEAWLSDTVLPDFGSQVGYDDVALTFFRGVYADSGALTGEALWTAAVTHQYELAKDAVLAVGADILNTLTDREVRIAPVICGFVVRISCNDQFSVHDGGRMLAFGPAQALLEVATTVQDLITEQSYIVWPACPEHGRGLMAEPSRPAPIWVCRTGPHTVAPVGSLVPPAAAAG